MTTLTQSQADTLIRNLLTCAQKTKSIESEAVGDTDIDAYVNLGVINPYLFGKMSIIPPLAKVADRIDGGGHVTLQELKNFVFLIERHIPIMQIDAVANQLDIPEWDDLIRRGKLDFDAE